MIRLGHIAVAVAAIGLAICRPVAAQTGDDLVEQGIQLMRAGDYQAALRDFQDANARDPSPKAVAEIGLAEQALGRWVDAEIHLTLALQQFEDAWIGRHRAALTTALAGVKGHLGAVVVNGTPRGAEVRFDGEVLGVVPLTVPARVAIGPHAIEVRSDGYKPFSVSVTIVPGVVQRVDVGL